MTAPETEPSHHLPSGAGIAVIGGIVGYYAISGLIAQRLGESWRSLLRRLPPALLLPAVILVPAGMLLPARAVTLLAGAVVLALFTGSKLAERRAPGWRSQRRRGVTRPDS